MGLANVVDVIATQLAKQRGRSVDRKDVPSPTCRYRGADGMMCAIGAIVPDELIAQVSEGQTVRSMMHHHVPIKEHLLTLLPEYTEQQATSILSAFQVFHDRPNFDGVDRNIYGVTKTYTDLIKAYETLSDDQLKETLVEHLVVIANHRAGGK